MGLLARQIRVTLTLLPPARLQIVKQIHLLFVLHSSDAGTPVEEELLPLLTYDVRYKVSFKSLGIGRLERGSRRRRRRWRWRRGKCIVHVKHPLIM